MMEKLENISIQFVKGVGPHKKKLFSRLGVETVEDLFYLFPRRYEDRRNIIALNKVKIGEWQTIRGKVTLGQARKSWYTKKHVFEIALDDGTGQISCVWFNQPFQAHYFTPGIEVVCFGKVDRYKDRLQMVSPEYERIEDEEKESLSLNRIVPMYPLTKGVTQRFVRKVLWQALEKHKEKLVDELPVELRNKYRLYNIKRSIESIHFPSQWEDHQEALKRISFEEFYFFQLSVLLRRLSMEQKQGFAHHVTDALMLRFVNGFNFELTAAQKKALREISADLKKPTPMLRLLQGDVGSGKTLVALFGALVAFENKHQAAFMAPTEILARQHYESFKEIFEGIKGLRDRGEEIERGKGIKGFRGKGIVEESKSQNLNTLTPQLLNLSNPQCLNTSTPRIALLISSIPQKEKDAILQNIKNGKIDLVIGTHALLNDEVVFEDLSYVVIDEQHKFGVRQRALLTEKGKNPDVLIMTATPIPRTLCISLYGDLDISIIDEMPKGRGRIVTEHFMGEEEEKVYKKVREKIIEGRQAYIVYPVIEESENNDLKAAQAMYKSFKKNIFKEFRVGLLHGQMKSNESDEVMAAFKRGDIDILVATTVLEVGVDVANATVMVIEHAERFGLAQLHQLRGRIGRGAHDSICLLIADPENQEAQRRIDAVLKTTDGFKIAEEDLLIRGPGHFFGRHQHGLNELKVANPVTQLDVLELARAEAKEILNKDPHLSLGKNSRLLQVIRARYPNYLQMVSAG